MLLIVSAEVPTLLIVRFFVTVQSIPTPGKPKPGGLTEMAPWAQVSCVQSKIRINTVAKMKERLEFFMVPSFIWKKAERIEHSA